MHVFKVPTEYLQPGSPNRLRYDNRFTVIQRDGLRCRWCNKYGKDFLTTDHIIPRRMGGSNKAHNLQLLCRRCHRKKTSLERKCGGEECRDWCVIHTPMHFVYKAWVYPQLGCLCFLKSSLRWGYATYPNSIVRYFHIGTGVGYVAIQTLRRAESI